MSLPSGTHLGPYEILAPLGPAIVVGFIRDVNVDISFSIRNGLLGRASEIQRSQYVASFPSHNAF